VDTFTVHEKQLKHEEMAAYWWTQKFAAWRTSRWLFDAGPHLFSWPEWSLAVALPWWLKHCKHFVGGCLYVMFCDNQLTGLLT